MEGEHKVADVSKYQAPYNKDICHPAVSLCQAQHLEDVFALCFFQSRAFSKTIQCDDYSVGHLMCWLMNFLGIESNTIFLL